MAETLRGFLLRVLRVPARPQPPAGDTHSVLTFRAARRYFQYRAALWGFKQLGALAALIAGTMFVWTVTRDYPTAARFMRWGEGFAWAAFVAQLPVTFMLMRLDFELRWYLLADRSLRIREGMFVVREKTMSYANIQNISIRRNPLQRIFGLATVAVRAAGGGSGASEHQTGHGSHTHEALFEGVDNADEIRQILRERIRRHRDSGLGDPDDVQYESDDVRGEPDHVHGDPDDVHGESMEVARDMSAAVLAARNLLAEARALRTVMSAQI